MQMFQTAIGFLIILAAIVVKVKQSLYYIERHKRILRQVKKNIAKNKKRKVS